MRTRPSTRPLILAMAVSMALVGCASSGGGGGPGERRQRIGQRGLGEHPTDRLVVGRTALRTGEHLTVRRCEDARRLGPTRVDPDDGDVGDAGVVLHSHKDRLV